MEDLDCRHRCLSGLCFSDNTPKECYVNNKCVALSCPEKAGDAPKFLHAKFFFQIHQKIKYNDFNNVKNDVWYVVSLPDGRVVGSGTPDYMKQIDAPAVPYGVKVDYFPGLSPMGTGRSVYPRRAVRWQLLFNILDYGQSSDRGKGPEVHLCKPAQGNEDMFGCEDPKKVGWSSTDDDHV